MATGKIIECRTCKQVKQHGARGECIVCARRTYVRENPEKVKTQKLEHYEKHKERVKEKSRSYYHENRKNIISRVNAKRAANPEIFVRYSRTQYDRHSEKIKAAARDYYRRNPASAKAAGARYRALKDSVTIEIVDFDLIMERSEGDCALCGLPVDPDKFHFDHTIPLSRGGWHTTNNLQVAHPFCNISKKNKLFARLY
jgi:5-methylcytosine-specific restriction endonuclease McrA